MFLLPFILCVLLVQGVQGRNFRSEDSSWALRRSFPIILATPVPGAVPNQECGDDDWSTFLDDLNYQSKGCTSRASYDWKSSKRPTDTEREQFCACTNIQQLTAPRCVVEKDGDRLPFVDLIEYVFGYCYYTKSPSSSSSNISAPSSSRGSTPPTVHTPAQTRTSDATSIRDVDSDSDSKDSQSLTPIIGGIAGGVVMVMIFVAFRCGRRRRKESDEFNRAGDKHEAGEQCEFEDPPQVSYGLALTPRAHARGNHHRFEATNSTKLTTSTDSGSGSHGANSTRAIDMDVSEDPAIRAARIPHDSIFFGPLISRGAYGEVFKGSYKGETVAIKQLKSERRKDMVQIDAFLTEVRLMSNLEHERIVKFIGVAWNSLSDACVVVEYMDNGDLRSVLHRWDQGEERRQYGFDTDKTKIAMHVAHALAYLHSLQPCVLHRDLKSKNILLNANYDAKLTDFGVSRERVESTMTSGVGSSLWMAPEVMMGERYNEKADIFSFGIVLSELDTHQLPYHHVKENGTNQKVADTCILQMVSLGRLTIKFSQNADPDLVKLGHDCVSLDPAKRPTAAQVLHRVHQVCRQQY